MKDEAKAAFFFDAMVARSGLATPSKRPPPICSELMLAANISAPMAMAMTGSSTITRLSSNIDTWRAARFMRPWPPSVVITTMAAIHSQLSVG